MQRGDLRSGLITKFKTDQNLIGVETLEFSYIFLMIRKVPFFRHQSTFGKFSFCSHIFLFHVSGNEVLYRDRTSPMHNWFLPRFLGLMSWVVGCGKPQWDGFDISRSPINHKYALITERSGQLQLSFFVHSRRISYKGQWIWPDACDGLGFKPTCWKFQLTQNNGLSHPYDGSHRLRHWLLVEKYFR